MTIRKLVVVIPCHRRWDLLPRAVAAAAPHPVVVVDDAPPGSRSPHPAGVTVVRTAGSQGFARAVNAGLQAAEALGASHALLLNDDAVPEADCIARLCAAWGPGVGAAGPILVDLAGQVESAGAEIRWWGRVRTRTTAPRTGGDVVVDGLSGACLLIPAARRLDEGFAHGFEDFALCRALSREGLRVVLVAGARCAHLGGATLGRDSRRAQRHAVSGHLRLLGRRRFVPVVVGLALAQVIREGGPAARALGIAGGVMDWWRAPVSTLRRPQNPTG